MQSSEKQMEKQLPDVRFSYLATSATVCHQIAGKRPYPVWQWSYASEWFTNLNPDVCEWECGLYLMLFELKNSWNVV